MPGTGEVRVRLSASAVNPADVNRRVGHLHTMEYAQRVGERVWIYFGQRGRAFGFPLHETAQAYLAVEAKNKLGTVVVLCDAP